MLPVLSQRTGAGGGLAERPGSAGRRRWAKNMLAAKEPVPRRRDGLRLMAQAGSGFGPEGAGPDGVGGPTSNWNGLRVEWKGILCESW